MAQELTEYTSPTYGSPYYDINEVDAVLAEKDAEIARLKADNERLLKIVLCQKYKIALMKAKWCEERCCRYSLQQEIQDVSWEKEIKFYRRLCAKYLELAEKFKR